MVGLKLEKGPLAAGTIPPQLTDELVLALLPQDRVQLVRVRRFLGPAMVGGHWHGDRHRNRNRHVVSLEAAVTFACTGFKFLQIAEVFKVLQKAFASRWRRGRLGVG